MFEGAKSLSISRNPIPFIPFPLARGRGRNRKRGFAPLRHPIKGWGELRMFKKGLTLLL
jgi:hypothetical protein